MNNIFLNEVANFSKDKLKKAPTETYHLSGKRYLRKAGELEEVETNIIKIYPDEENFDNNAISNSAYWSRDFGYVVDLIPDLSIDLVIDQLYISGEDVATNKEILMQHKITHILNLTTNIKNKFEAEIIYKNISCYDLPSQDVKKHFGDSFDFIEGALNSCTNSNVLIHCNAGVSRASSFVIAYLMQKRKFTTFKEACEFVKQKRSKICPNNGFVRQLKELENDLSQLNINKANC